MKDKKVIAVSVVISSGFLIFSFIQNPPRDKISEATKGTPISEINEEIHAFTTSLDPLPEQPLNLLFSESDSPLETLTAKQATADTKKSADKDNIFSVPFFSQFNDITPAEWKKVGCGIASLAMIIEFYEPGATTVDTLLKEGISAGAYSDAGWSHAGLINLSKKYGLNGTSNDLSGSTMDSAFTRLKHVLDEGPVMVSVHYTFDPKNPIPHLVVINGVRDGKVYYNDPAEKSGGRAISVDQFQSAWKKRYIQIQST